MRIIRHLIIIIPFIIFVEGEYMESDTLQIAERDKEFDPVTAKINNQSNDKASINLSLESITDIYGVQFSIRYNIFEIVFNKDLLISNIPNVRTYSTMIKEGVVRVLMLSSSDGKRGFLDSSKEKMIDLINIEFQPKKEFHGASTVELFDIALAGKAGTEVVIDNSIKYTYEVSFLLPNRTTLSKDLANPFNLKKTIDYSLSQSDSVYLIIYDQEGKIVKTLVEEFQEANYYHKIWDGLNNDNKSVPSGHYILKMATSDFSDSTNITFLK